MMKLIFFGLISLLLLSPSVFANMPPLPSIDFTNQTLSHGRVNQTHQTKSENSRPTSPKKYSPALQTTGLFAASAFIITGGILFFIERFCCKKLERLQISPTTLTPQNSLASGSFSGIAADAWEDFP